MLQRGGLDATVLVLLTKPHGSGLRVLPWRHAIVVAGLSSESLLLHYEWRLLRFVSTELSPTIIGMFLLFARYAKCWNGMAMCSGSDVKQAESRSNEHDGIMC